MWCHTCWGNPAQQRIFRDVQSYQPTLEALNQVDADALTFEICSSGTGDLEAIGRIVTDKKVMIGVIDHHTLQIERPDQVADIAPSMCVRSARCCSSCRCISSMMPASSRRFSMRPETT